MSDASGPSSKSTPKEDPDVNPAGVKGIGELANVGIAAAIANAV
jgi:xanthine dehydrogenase YagR molybdenum-binding subunit